MKRGDERTTNFTPWTCYARPAATEKTCGFRNTLPFYGYGMASRLLCCSECGCTKAASDARVTKEAGR